MRRQQKDSMIQTTCQLGRFRDCRVHLNHHGKDRTTKLNIIYIHWMKIMTSKYTFLARYVTKTHFNAKHFPQRINGRRESLIRSGSGPAQSRIDEKHLFCRSGWCSCCDACEHALCFICQMQPINVSSYCWMMASSLLINLHPADSPEDLPWQNSIPFKIVLTYLRSQAWSHLMTERMGAWNVRHWRR